MTTITRVRVPAPRADTGQGSNLDHLDAMRAASKKTGVSGASIDRMSAPAYRPL